MHHQSDGTSSFLPPLVSVSSVAFPLLVVAAWAILLATGTAQQTFHQAFFDATAWVLLPGFIVLALSLPTLFVPRLGLLRLSPLVLAALLFTTLALLQCTSARDWEPEHCEDTDLANPLGNQEGCAPWLSVGPEFGWGMLAVFQSASLWKGR